MLYKKLEQLGLTAFEAYIVARGAMSLVLRWRKIMSRLVSPCQNCGH